MTMRKKKQKTFEDWTFEELVDHATAELIHDIINGVKFRAATWRAVEIAVRWRAAQDKGPNE